MKSLLLMLAVCASGALAESCAWVVNSNIDQRSLCQYNDNARTCFCVTNTQTISIFASGIGNVKLFSTADCTGNYATLGNGKTQENAQWVNSISVGKAGISSSGPNGCPNYYL
ncbi:hypothetical protein BG000_000196 [Podila horticola]|nr:hypothetical protein BG003_011638 [Podila horticola]KAG0329131.1 hypothetical protein BG000_000196 [Podila horticola]